MKDAQGLVTVIMSLELQSALGPETAFGPYYVSTANLSTLPSSEVEHFQGDIHSAAGSGVRASDHM